MCSVASLHLILIYTLISGQIDKFFSHCRDLNPLFKRIISEKKKKIKTATQISQRLELHAIHASFSYFSLRIDASLNDNAERHTRLGTPHPIKSCDSTNPFPCLHLIGFHVGFEAKLR